MKNLLIFFISSSILLMSCKESLFVKIGFEDTNEDCIVNPEFLNTISSKKNISVIVKSPLRTAGDLSNGKEDENGSNTSKFYDNVEKVFIKNGFTVRDRSIFDKIINSNKEFDMEKLYELTKTDILIEITNIESVKFLTNTVKDINNNKDIVLNFPINDSGVKLDCKLIDVRNNIIVSSFTSVYNPCPENSPCGPFEVISTGPSSGYLKRINQTYTTTGYNYSENSSGAYEALAKLVSEELVKKLKTVK